MQLPQFQAQRPQGVQSQVAIAPPSSGGKGQVLGQLARVAFGAYTGGLSGAIGAGLGGMGGGGGSPESGATSSTTGTAGQKKTGLEQEEGYEADQPAVAPLPAIGDWWNGQMYGVPIQAPPSPFQGQGQMQPNLQTQLMGSQMPNASQDPNLWVNRLSSRLSGGPP